MQAPSDGLLRYVIAGIKIEARNHLEGKWMNKTDISNCFCSVRLSSLQSASIKLGSVQKRPLLKFLETGCVTTFGGCRISLDVLGMAGGGSLLSQSFNIQNVPFALCQVPYYLWFLSDISFLARSYVVPFLSE